MISTAATRTGEDKKQTIPAKAWTVPARTWYGPVSSRMTRKHFDTPGNLKQKQKNILKECRTKFKQALKNNKYHEHEQSFRKLAADRSCPHGKHQTLPLPILNMLQLACIAKDCGEAGRNDFLSLCSLSSKYDKKCKSTFNSRTLHAIKEDIHLGTVFHLAGQCG